MSTLQLTDEREVYYELLDGDPAKPYLVFLHEGLGCCSMWRDFPARLCRATGCPGLLYDRTGYGRSSPLKAELTIHYMHHAALRELPEVLRKTIADKDFLLLGHSDGGSISLIFGAERPPSLRGIITEAAHVFVEPETIAGISKAAEAFGQGKLQGLYRHHGEKTQAMFKAWSGTWLSSWFSPWNIEYLLPSITCPLLAIQGLDDVYGTRKQVEAIVSKTTGRLEAWLFENCGHAPHLEKPELVLEQIGLFVAELARE